MKIILPGGSGQIGNVMASALRAQGHTVIILGRNPAAQAGIVAWDAETLGPWAIEFENADVVINLAGRSVNCRYTKENLRQIMDSRVNSTRVIGQAIAKCARPPRIWLNSSTATIYSHRFEAPNDEFTGEIGGNEPDVPAYWAYSIKVAQAWEKECLEAPTPKTRKVLLRSAMVMSPDRGGVFDALLGLVRKGLGGKAGDGRQFVSWIHDTDFVNSILWLIDHDEISGPINICAPNPLPNSEFMRDLRAAWGTRIGLPAAKWMLHVGAVFMRTDTELILKSRRVVPGQLVKTGFQFQFPSWPLAAAALCKRWREVVKTS